MQNALMVNHKFGPITRTTRPIPQTADLGEIIVKVRATALNSADWMIPKWGIIASEYPVVLGFDIAGDVVSVGEDVTKFVVGDRV
jgi:NADPH:quinone reductase-like Zn-dependent oxidoreductase